MKKILIMERVSEIEQVLATYLNQTFKGCKIELLDSLDTQSKETIVAKIMQADIIAAQSIFDDTTSFEKIVHLFEALKIKKPVYIIHSLGNLLEAVNFRISIEAHKALCRLLHAGQQVYNVYYKSFENPDNNKQAMFKLPPIIKFDTIKIYYNEAERIIWDERPKFIANSQKTFYRYTPYYLEQPPKFENLTGKDVSLLMKMLSEVYVTLEENKEDLEYGRGWKFDKEETAALIKDKTKRLALLDKMKVEPYK